MGAHLAAREADGDRNRASRAPGAETRNVAPLPFAVRILLLSAKVRRERSDRQSPNQVLGEAQQDVPLLDEGWTPGVRPVIG